jgi:hypothetical protein
MVWHGLSEVAREGLGHACNGVMGSPGASLYQAADRHISTRLVNLHFHALAPARWTRPSVGFSYTEDGCYTLEDEMFCARLTGLDAMSDSSAIGGVVALAADDREDQVIAWKIALTAASNAIAATVAPALGALMLHGCAMVPEGSGRALLFVGPSGAGKSTMVSRLDSWRPLGDDRLILWFEEDRPVVAGTPFISKNWLPCWGEPHELAGIVWLEPHSAELLLEPQTEAEAYAKGIRSTFLTCAEGPVVGRTLELIERLMSTVPAYTLHSQLEHEIEPLLEGLL